ncbi:MAG: sce7726 family protein [Lachnospiraceae bacterium]|uniref:sce7726 family protein n=1 Tax=Roseburia hominis TaxID=301301 RepID=UPI001F35F1CF|nr:sce7726 family protein [Roseburia hominis]MDD6170694.1 sce7726 family protein [Lachnospiraceae bacterium]MDY4840035.1 sce7726 family protein [Lachnospiraceae bacterium]
MLYDKDIREPLFEFLEEKYGKIRIIEEKQMGKSRADIMMVLQKALVGIEIKSDADTYARLERQIKDYNRFFDYNYVVVGSKHAKHIKEHVPEWWGIISVELIEETVDFYVIREATINKKCNRKKKLGLLWRPELAHIQEINGMPKYKEKSKAFVIDKILTKIPEELLSEQISQELFERDYNEIENTIKAYKAERKTRKKANPS